MKKANLTLLTTILIALTSVLFLDGCGKTSTTPVTKTTTTTTITGSRVIYSLDDTLNNTPTQLWGIGIDGTANQKIAISVPSNLHFEFNSDIAAEVSTDNKTMVLSLESSDESTTYFYKCNIDGSGIQQIPNVSGYLYLQTFINSTSILYWKNSDNGHNGELWKVNTDGSGNQKINISLPTNIAFGDGKFSKVTADGKTIVFSTFSGIGGQSALYKCNIDGSGLTQIVSQYSLNMQALVNNTSALIDMTNSSIDQGGLFIVSLSGGSPQLVLAQGLLPAGATFADSRAVVAGSTLFFVTGDAHDTQTIYSSNTDGSNIKLVANVPAGYAVKLQGIVQ